MIKKTKANSLTVIGGGLSGCEAAWQAASLGVSVRLYEMRPAVMTPAHTTGGLSELVCSNSLGSKDPDHPSGCLKNELRYLKSLILSSAEETMVPAGGSLAVDRIRFIRAVESRIFANPLIKVIRQEITSLQEIEKPAVLATGPLTSRKLMESIDGAMGQGSLYMYDAVAPIVSFESIDCSKVFSASRYGKGEADYINCPMDKEQYLRFYNELIGAERVPLNRTEDMKLFEACMPIEEMADRGEDTIRFGPLKPVGLVDPITGKMPYAVVQLRKEDLPGSSYNLVGFQTRLKWPEQKRVFSLIPGLEKAEFIRYGVVHRNAYLNSPALIGPDMMFTAVPGLFAGGQLTGSEGYIESVATGALAGINGARFVKGEPLLVFPEDTCIGSLAKYVSKGKGTSFDPMSINFGLLPEPEVRFKGRKGKRQAQIDRARNSFKAFMEKAVLETVG